MEFYTTKEASEQLLVGKETIRRYIRSGQLKAYKVNRHYLISKDSVNEFIQSNLATSLNVSINKVKEAVKPKKPDVDNMSIEERKQSLIETMFSKNFSGNVEEIFKQAGIDI